MYVLLCGGRGEIADPDGEVGLAESEGRGGERGDSCKSDKWEGDGGEDVEDDVQGVHNALHRDFSLLPTDQLGQCSLQTQQRFESVSSAEFVDAFFVPSIVAERAAI